jgi:DNA-binding NtrC family response regulator
MAHQLNVDRPPRMEAASTDASLIGDPQIPAPPPPLPPEVSDGADAGGFVVSGPEEALDVLLIDDEPDLRASLEEAVRDAGHRVTVANDGAEGLGQVTSKVFDVIICDVRLPKLDGLTLMRRVRQESPSTEVILMTAFAEVADAVAALKEGAYDYLTKPFEIDELLFQLKRIAQHRSLRRELERARAELAGRRQATTLVGRSPSMRRVVGLVEVVSQSDAPVLVTGDSGTGKELVARMLHERSSRRDQPFIAVNCGALTETLIEAELFGHERGAFTGAVKKRDGRFKAANGGTLFLDEVAELPMSAQAKLLRVLQEGTFEPLGTNTTMKVDVRVLSATHRDLKKRIADGTFREDLYYRINVIEIPMPPLRDRPGDLPLLLQHFLQRFVPPGRPLPTVSPGAWAALCQHPFPGNVREFSHAIEHAVVLSGGGEIRLEHLPSSITAGARAALAGGDLTPRDGDIRPLQVAVKEFEREYLLRAIAQASGKRLRAAEILGISRKSLWEKLRMHGISDAEIEAQESANARS